MIRITLDPGTATIESESETSTKVSRVICRWPVEKDVQAGDALLDAGELRLVGKLGSCKVPIRLTGKLGRADG